MASPPLCCNAITNRCAALQMTSDRMPAPTNSTVDMGKSVTSYMDASTNYSKNKYRGQGTAIVFG
jgi:hypothetical protein